MKPFTVRTSLSQAFLAPTRWLLGARLLVVGVSLVVVPATWAIENENPTMEPVKGFPSESEAVDNQSIQEKMNYSNRFVWREKKREESPEVISEKREAFEARLQNRKIRPEPSNADAVTRKLKPAKEPNIIIGE
jgi:hypothetical protein